MNANVEVHEFVVGKLLFAFDSMSCDARVCYEPEECFAFQMKNAAVKGVRLVYVRLSRKNEELDSIWSSDINY